MSVSTASHGPPLSRMYTAPTNTTRATSMNSYPGGMGHASRSSQSGPTTPSPSVTPASASASSASLLSMSSSQTLVSPSSASLLSTSSSQTLVSPRSGGSVVATNNIINQRADASRSLYQICVSLRQRLRQVPAFEQHLNDLKDEEEGEGVDTDPMSSLWRCLRKGYPLMTIYNSLQPKEPLQIAEGITAKNIPKNAAFKFVQACLLNLEFEECFVLTDLFGDDTTGFVKVTQVINKVLDIADARGLLLTTETRTTEDTSIIPSAQMSYRDYVVREIVDTERKYVQDLENLHELKKIIEQKGVIPGDAIHDIFLNINAILDFQRRFLIKLETTNSQPEEKQEWGSTFVNSEEGFKIYLPFIANQRKAAAIAKREFDKIAMADHPVVVDFNTLDGFLLKPMQRLVKYPLLLKDLRDKTDANEETKAELTAGIEAANRILQQANAAVDRELRNEALAELCALVEDWKNHEVSQFGDLLLHGQFTVVTGKSETEKEYSIYLFERILLCCKEINPNKAARDKLVGSQKEKKDKKEKDKRDKNKTGKVKLQLKGRIFMTNVTDVVSLVKPGSYTVQIWWKGDPGVENFIIRFLNEEVMKKWSTAVDTQRKLYATEREHLLGGANSSPPEFPWMRELAPALSNPYAQHEDDDEEEFTKPSPVYSQQPSFNVARNASSSSLRSRSTTSESTQSIAGLTRVPPPRYPIPTPPLTLQTQAPSQIPSPMPVPEDSYFSPVADSPGSQASQTPMYSFPRQGTPLGGWEENNRYTAPATSRAPSNHPLSNHYQMNGRNPQRPSLPAMASHQQPQMSQQRLRSYSTPDINGPNGTARRQPNGGAVPAVPGIPAHLHPAYDAGIPRSNNNSPSNGIAIRANSQSPGAQRERLIQQAPHYNTPQYLRNAAQMPMPAIDGRTISPSSPNNMLGLGDIPLPTQLKVKVNCDGNYVTLVVAFSITYQSLIDRIDAKVGRFSNNAISRGTMRLRYQDEDGDFVTIESDDDIQIAFQEWREAQKHSFHTGQLGEIELFCASVEN